MAEKLFLGAKLRKLREARGWTLEACAERLGLSPSYLSHLTIMPNGTDSSRGPAFRYLHLESIANLRIWQPLMNSHSLVGYH